MKASLPLMLVSWLICIAVPSLVQAKALSFEQQQMDSAASYQTGITLGEHLFSKLDGASSMLTSANSPTCMDMASDELQQQLRSIAGFNAHQQLLAQITDFDKRQKICRVWKNHRQYVQECEQELSESAQKNVRPTGLLALIKVICDEEAMRVVEQNAYCFGDTEHALQQRCIDACRNQSGMPLINQQNLIVHQKIIENPETICKIGVCSIRCLSAQIQECEEDGNEIKDLYSSLSGAQMLFGMESAAVQASNSINNNNNSISASRLIQSLFKSSKMPSKCQMLIQQSMKNSARTTTITTNQDEQAKNKNMF